MLFVPGTKIQYRSDPTPQVSDDGGLTWYFTFRSPSEFMEMWPTAISDAPPQVDDLDERELFGETLDDEIPDDLWDMIKGTP